MVIKTKSIYEPSEENDDGIRVLVTRFYPRGISVVVVGLENSHQAAIY
jgi:uncharacterized protein YeaO (DUF488 family)